MQSCWVVLLFIVDFFRALRVFCLRRCRSRLPAPCYRVQIAGKSCQNLFFFPCLCNWGGCPTHSALNPVMQKSAFCPSAPHPPTGIWGRSHNSPINLSKTKQGAACFMCLLGKNKKLLVAFFVRVLQMRGCARTPGDLDSVQDLTSYLRTYRHPVNVCIPSLSAVQGRRLERSGRGVLDDLRLLTCPGFAGLGVGSGLDKVK